MFIAIKEKFTDDINQREIAERVGIDESTLSRIINGKQTTQKSTAYCIVKAIDPNAEVKDYFVRKGD